MAVTRLLDPAEVRKWTNKRLDTDEAKELLSRHAVYLVPYDDTLCWTAYGKATDLVIVRKPCLPRDPGASVAAVPANPGRGYFVPRNDLDRSRGGPTYKVQSDDGVVRATYRPATDYIRTFEELQQYVVAVQSEAKRKTVVFTMMDSARLNVELSEPAHYALIKAAIRRIDRRADPSFKSAAMATYMQTPAFPVPWLMLSEASGIAGSWRPIPRDELPLVDPSDSTIGTSVALWVEHHDVITERYFVTDSFVYVPTPWIAKRSAGVLHRGKFYVALSELTKKPVMVELITALLCTLVPTSGIVPKVIAVRTALRTQRVNLRADPTDEFLAEMIVANSSAKSLKWMKRTRDSTWTTEEMYDAAPRCIKDMFNAVSTGHFGLKHGHRFQVAAAIAMAASALRVDIEDLAMPYIERMQKTVANAARVETFERQLKFFAKKNGTDVECWKRPGMGRASEQMACPFRVGMDQPKGANAVACCASRGGAAQGQDVTTMTPAEIWLTTGPLVWPDVPDKKPTGDAMEIQRKRAHSTDGSVSPADAPPPRRRIVIGE